MGVKTQPQEVLDLQYNDQGEAELLVKWKNLPDYEISWELITALQQSLPTFHLEDKVRLGGRSIDGRPVVKRVNVRKEKRGVASFPSNGM